MKRSPITLLAWATLGLLSACSSPETIQIIITPTPDPDHSTETLTPTRTNTPTIEFVPAETVMDEASEEPTESVISTTPLPPLPTLLGPVTNPDYILPTLPPQPTATLMPPLVQTEVPTDGPSPTPLPGLDPELTGIQLHSQVDFTDFQTAVGLADATGANWIKLQVNWAFLQPTAPNEWNEQMALFERQVELASRPEDMKVLLSIAKAPQWTRSNQIEDGPPDDPQALADFITLMLKSKIGPSIDAIEIWNEPNLAREWRGVHPLSGAGYMQLFQPAYDAIRAYSPTITIVTAGLAPTGTTDQTVDDRTFLQQMYNAGLANYSDVVVGAHPYGWGNHPDSRCCNPTPDRGWDDDPHFFFLHNIEDLYTIMSNNGDGDNRMWITEVGWATWEGLPNNPPEPFMGYISAIDQAHYTIRALEIAQDLEYVGPMFLWNLNFANENTVANRQEIVGYSLIVPTIFPQERPLYQLLMQAIDDT